MDIGEKLFGIAAAGFKHWKSRKQRDHAQIVKLDDVYVKVSLFFNATSSTSGVVIRETEGLGAVYPEVLLLPSEIKYFDTQSLNELLYLHKALAAGIIYRDNLRFSSNNLSFDQKNAAIMKYADSIQKSLRAEFVHYDEFFEDLLREQEISSEFFLELMRRDIQITSKAEVEISLPQRKELTSESQLQAKTPSEIEQVDLKSKKDQENPLLHSFEKLETADEYSGGYRVQDGSDQLSEHAAALEELNLKTVTRDGDGAASTYQAEISDLMTTPESALSPQREKACLYYPEWDYKSRCLLPKHCRLYVSKCSMTKFLEGDVSDESGQWIANVQEYYGSNIDRWRNMLDGLVNQRLWRDNQLDGSEINIDAFVRYHADVRLSGKGDPRLFVRKVLSNRDLSCLILVDQSLSTDSWVQNRRVLDIELEAIGLMSLLLRDNDHQFGVAGFYSETRNHCYFKWYKQFDDVWGQFHEAAPKIQPIGYTRLGPAIRHSVKVLAEQNAKQRLLIVLTDGKPTDHDKYEGRYGVLDIHHALLEANQKGVAVKALAVEANAKYYFPLMFGHRDYQILNDPALLPEYMFKIYGEVLST